MRRTLAAAAGLVADELLGEPPVPVHPVVWLGRGLTRVEHAVYADDRRAGAVHAIAGAAIGLAAGTAVPSTALAAYVTVAGSALRDAARSVAAALDGGDIAAARERLPALVGRDPSCLDEKEICRAVVESVAENTVDAVVAPALWASVAGARGAYTYRAANTMDAMVGHRSARYRNFGWAAARLDDVAAWVPARVTAALVAACRPRAARDVARIVRRDAAAHPSPNGGVAEAAFAAALGLRLGGENRYDDRVELRPVLGDGRPPERHDITRAVALSRDAGRMLAAVLAVAGARP